MWNKLHACTLFIIFLFSSSVNASQVTAILTDVSNHNGATWSADVSGDASWSYDTLTGVVTGSGTFDADFYAGPGPTLYFSYSIEDLVVGGGNNAGATSFTCIEGDLAGQAGGVSCANYAINNNGDESSWSYGPGTAFSRTIGGDDTIVADQHNIAFWDGMTSNLIGNTLTLTNNTDGGDQYVPQLTMTFTVSEVPVPAAVWLFVSGLGLLGWRARKRS